MARAGKGAGRDGIRLFISLDPPPASRLAAAEWGRSVARSEPGLRPVGERAIHLTLAFLGTLPAGQVDGLAGAIERIARPLPVIETGAPLWLPKRRPRALALEVREPTGVLDSLRADLVGELGRETGWHPERPGFLPHLTVARASRGFTPARTELEPAPALCFEPVSVTLYRSHLEPEGARYESLFSLSLGARASGDVDDPPGAG